MARYRFRLIAGLLAYGLLLSCVAVLFGNKLVPAPIAPLVALVPMLPCLIIVWAAVQYTAECDELQRLILLQALSFGFALTAFATFSYGFLERYAGAPRVSMFAVWPFQAGAWIVGTFIAKRKYG